MRKLPVEFCKQCEEPLFAGFTVYAIYDDVFCSKDCIIDYISNEVDETVLNEDDYDGGSY